MFKRRNGRLLAPAAAAAALALAAAGCAQSERDTGGDPNETQPLIFAGTGDPRSLDPALANDGETFRVTRQVMETLLVHESGGTEIQGGLAESWEQSEDGTEWTFHLREGVTFHDGEPLDAEAVCANFDRWYNFTGDYQSSNQTYYWQNVFGGFAENEDDELPESIYDSCTAEDGLTPVITLTESSAAFPGGFTLSSFGIMSPASIEAVADQEVGGEEGAPVLPEYSQEAGAIAGTGPYTYGEWDHDAQEVTLERNDDYWGEPAGIKTVIIKTISEESARRQALEAGDVHGYDLVAPADVQPLKDAGFQVPQRDVFNILYMAYNQEASEELEDPEVRRALAHAVDRQRIVDTILPEGAQVATQFIPETVEGWSPDVATYDYDPDRARELLEEAGQEDLTIDFCYPTEVTRPYMPAPKDIFDVIQSDLKDAGITVEADSKPWDEYIPHTDSGNCSLYLLGWTGDYNEAYNFLGTWFGGYDSAWGFRDDEVFEAMETVASEPDPEARVGLYQDANEIIMDYLPGLPISHSPPSIVFSPDVEPPAASPLTQERFQEASFK
ncbi:ABC transporter substrate-binding protein [Nocardiopsis suaedae]|uniref:ABC transporter substrate-binding protein n=1 Tax=Nocardiopsis suaedae TaxID=3018444 RepID=A0ABT4TRJ4_9ACTN|nr:ABC transporter substrate-binding protein [Nocardiopsis suaedae]MDA2807315.1 ABC transporter substrate-binding protein [Nocardiopsis suaedae]